LKCSCLGRVSCGYEKAAEVTCENGLKIRRTPLYRLPRSPGCRQRPPVDVRELGAAVEKRAVNVQGNEPYRHSFSLPCHCAEGYRPVVQVYSRGIQVQVNELDHAKRVKTPSEFFPRAPHDSLRRKPANWPCRMDQTQRPHLSRSVTDGAPSKHSRLLRLAHPALLGVLTALRTPDVIQNLFTALSRSL
jgi:hypothetical protein